MSNVCEKCGKLYTPDNDLCADCDLAETTELYEEITQLRAEIEKYKMGKVSPADYYSMAESEEKLCKELAEAQELIKKLRRCANCKHRVEYGRFGEVATACALDVNEEENQTCKKFDKWEAE